MQRSKKDHIVEIATELFHNEGFNATGIEKIKCVANVSKKTLYNHFASKNDLILTVLQKEQITIRNWLAGGLASVDRTAREQLIAMFDMYAMWINSPRFRGCLFIKATSEFLDPDSRCNSASIEAKKLVRKEIERMATKANAINPSELAAKLDLLIQGATVLAQVENDKLAIYLAKEIAVQLIDEAIITAKR